jgi:hypothetical protein
VLKRLVGHPSIPAVFAYGRFDHFEYPAMELLGHDLEDVLEKTGPLAFEFVPNIADQTVGATMKPVPISIELRDIDTSCQLWSTYIGVEYSIVT